MKFKDYFDLEQQEVNITFKGEEDTDVLVYFKYHRGTKLSPGHPYANRDTGYESDDPPEIEIYQVIKSSDGTDITDQLTQAEEDIIVDKIDTKGLTESKKHKKSFTQIDAIKSVRKPMPPPSKVHKGEKDYKRDHKKVIEKELKE